MPTQGSDFDPTPEPFDWEAIARYLTGESPPAEVRAVRLWLDANPDRAAVVHALDRSIARLAALDASVDVEGALASVRARMDEPAEAAPPSPVGGRGTRTLRFAPRVASHPPMWRRPAAWIAAAAVVAIAVIGIARGRAHDAPILAARDLATTVGKIDTLALPDGSRIVVGPDSRVTVAAGFGTRSREVTLEGDGYFDVVHDPSIPFTVHAGGATIVDVGTVFTVHVDQGVAAGRVAVRSGSVRLTRSDESGGGLLLRAGDVATFDSTLAYVRASSSVDDALAWTRGTLVFRDAPLREVASDLRRWYGLDLRLDDPALASRRLTATFEGESADQVLAVIGSALGIELARQGDLVVVGAPARAPAPAGR
ncbi:MAG: DUF4974 domain-containing protein [Gemmatimonadaceae bacterium]|nr:DUF4974 domain-containing protein [Gemmatimonadaceae bacterium]NUQ91735.1 DUF4974 domain-containing protein [Gemmatimonadaceae bacterium]NUR19362.1 DUF4974 domain-containing protein [Gemmatimonadaceae bacterium]NUS98782.1 DUF4974 domain-containing protein [Gemmatimonadaceae bacterium]